jgi:hypothetical protein
VHAVPPIVKVHDGVLPYLDNSYHSYDVAGGNTVGAVEIEYAVSVTSQSLSVPTVHDHDPVSVAATSTHSVAKLSVPLATVLTTVVE